MLKEGESDFVLGIEPLIDTGDHHLVLDSADLDESSNLTETGAYVTVIEPHQRVSLFGGIRGIPSPQSFTGDQEVAWDAKRPLAGTLVPPRSSGDFLNLLVFVHSRDPDVDASVNHLVVHYHSGRQQYVYTGNVRYRLAGHKC
jgi:hypothetical protein